MTLDREGTVGRLFPAIRAGPAEESHDRGVPARRARARCLREVPRPGLLRAVCGRRDRSRQAGSRRVHAGRRLRNRRGRSCARAQGRLGGRGGGVDVNEQMVTFAARRSNGPASLEWQVADAAALPFIDSSFDLVTCQQGLQFFSDQSAGVREMHRVLAPGRAAGTGALAADRAQPAFEVLAESLERHVSAEAGAMVRAPFAAPSIERLHQMLTGRPSRTSRGESRTCRCDSRRRASSCDRKW